jgi:DNA-binding response OmpR family regulator
MKILIIEDEQELANNSTTYLKEQNYQCELPLNYHEAVLKIEIYEYDCILLDLMLPDAEGLQLLEILRNQSKRHGIIIISAKNTVEAKITGLQLGADDYLAKPFHLSELGARIFSVIRRSHF